MVLSEYFFLWQFLECTEFMRVYIKHLIEEQKTNIAVVVSN